MTPVGQARLQQLRDAKARRFVERAQADDANPAELRDLRDQLGLLDQALAEAQHGRHAGRWALGASALGIALLCSAGALIPVPRAAFSAEIEASSITLHMLRGGGLSSVPVSREMQVEGFGRAASADPALRAQASRAGGQSLTLRGDGLRLQRLAWSDDSLLRMDAGSVQVRVTVEATQELTVLALETAGPTEIEASDGAGPQHRDFGPGEWLKLDNAAAASPGARPAPLVLLLGRPLVNKGETEGASYAWRLPEANAIDFVERQAGEGGATVFDSSLLSAKFTLPQTGGEVTLRQGDRLALDGLVLERCELRVGSTVRLRLAGTAAGLHSAVGGFSRSHKPSLLEVLAHNHTLALIWGAAVFLWGGRAWLQKLFGGA